MSLTRKDVQHIAALCRISLTSSEADNLREQLSDILEQFRVLQEVDTQGITPTSHSMSLRSVMREDEVAPCLDLDSVLANAPRREQDYFRINVVLDE